MELKKKKYATFVLVLFFVEFKTRHGGSVKSACSAEFDDGNYWKMWILYENKSYTYLRILYEVLCTFQQLHPLLCAKLGVCFWCNGEFLLMEFVQRSGLLNYGFLLWAETAQDSNPGGAAEFLFSIPAHPDWPWYPAGPFIEGTGAWGKVSMAWHWRFTCTLCKD